MKNGAKILIVDDDSDFVEINKTILESKQYDVDSASNPDEAWEKVNSTKPDLVILDVMMPTGTEGFHFAYKLRQDQKLKKLPVLMITQINQESSFNFSPDTDGDFLPVEDFLEKPVTAEDLLSSVERLLQKASDHAWEKVDTYKGIGLKDKK